MTTLNTGRAAQIQTDNPEPGVERSQGRGEDGTSSAITHPREDIPGRYSCSLISQHTAYPATSQSMWHQQSLASLHSASTLWLLGHTASLNIGFALGWVIPSVLWGLFLMPSPKRAKATHQTKEKSGWNKSASPLKIPKPWNPCSHLRQTTPNLQLLGIFWKSPLLGFGNKSQRQPWMGKMHEPDPTYLKGIPLSPCHPAQIPVFLLKLIAQHTWVTSKPLFQMLFSTRLYRLVWSLSLSTPPSSKLFIRVKLLPTKLVLHNGWEKDNTVLVKYCHSVEELWHGTVMLRRVS